MPKTTFPSVRRTLAWSTVLLGVAIALPPAHAAEGQSPAARKDLVVDDAALIKDWKPPVYPESALAEKLGGRVTIRIVVDATGAITAARVLKGVEPRLDEAALAAVKQWTFSPASEGGKPIACCLDVPVKFDPEQKLRDLEYEQKKKKTKRQSLLPAPGELPVMAPMTAAQPKVTPPGEYPVSLKARRIPGWVRFACRVGVDGRVKEPKIQGASHADFILPAFAALARWEFTPARQGDVVIEREMSGEVTFDEVGGKPAAVLKANEITGPEGADPAAYTQILGAADAVWPIDFLLKGTAGEAVIAFTVTDRGGVADLKVVSASEPDFGRAALAALEMWDFEAGMSGGRRISVPLWKKVTFAATPVGGAAADDELAALVRALREGKVAGASGLDERLTPLLRVSPIYPAALLAAGRPTGSAEIEFVICRDGRARLPRIVTATHEEFGWSAATAINQWIFKAPLREGKPVDVKVRIPVSFTPPEK